MLNFRTGGIYIYKYDANIEGYYTSNKDGTIKKNKYGLLDKLYDVLRSGRTQEISYDYFYFKRQDDTEDILLYTGSISDEFTNIFSQFKKGALRLDHDNNVPYEVINANKILVKNVKGENILWTHNEGLSLFYEYYGLLDDITESRKYSFFSLAFD